jgi:hypothetical protein
MSVAESVQKDGMEGVDLAQRWLESTTWIELPFNVYDNSAVCTLTKLDGTVKRYDLFGSIFTKPIKPLYVEVKNYDSSGVSNPQNTANSWPIRTVLRQRTSKAVKTDAESSCG